MPQRRGSLLERMEEFFLAHPKASFNAEALMKHFTEANEGTVRQYITVLSKRKSAIQGAVIIKDTWKRGFWKLNPAYKTMDQIRGIVDTHITDNQRVFQSDKGFDPLEPPITSMDNPNLPIRRLFFTSIIERMNKSEQFTGADVEMLKREVPHLVASKEGEK